MLIFEYGQKEIEYLKSSDKKLGAAIDKIGMIKREITPNPFTALVSSVVSQQISKKAAETVWNRLANLLGSIKPEGIVLVVSFILFECYFNFIKSYYLSPLIFFLNTITAITIMTTAYPITHQRCGKIDE